MKRRVTIVAGLILASFILAVSCREEGDGSDASDNGKVTITLHQNTASDMLREFEVTKGQAPGREPSWYPASPDRVFLGWFRDADCTVPFDFMNDVVNEPLDLYAGYGPELIIKDLGKVARVTGRTSGESLPNPNRTDNRWNLGGTDLGIIWEMADGNYGIFFGDSYGNDFIPCGGGPGRAGDWRSNVLAFSESTDFSQGLVFSDMYHEKGKENRAAAVIVRENYYSFTYIPTAAISLDGKEYMHYMYWEVGSRDRVKENYSSFVVSDDCGKSWSNCKGKIRFDYDSYFGMVALGKKPGDPYCYMMGTQTGNGYRNSTARVARFLPEDVLDKSKYEYWYFNMGQWVKGREDLATDVLDGTVGELSLMYFEQYDRWLAMYFDSAQYAICYRSAARPNGPWSQERILCRGSDYNYAQLYGSYIHPACAKREWPSDLMYWTISQWQPYNVFLMKSQISLSNN